MARLADIVVYLDTELRTAEIPDAPTALNGLQLGNPGEVTHVAAAVDYSTVAIHQAIARGADLLLLHHGMYWGGLGRLTGDRYDRLSMLVKHDIAVYSSHLPLDLHPLFGNNAILAGRLGLEPNGGFVKHGSIDVGLRGECDIETAVLVSGMRDLAAAHAGTVITTPIVPGRRTKRWGMCTGAAGASSDSLREAVDCLGLDTLLVGEGPHHTAVYARDLDIAVVYAGHYATETLGVQAMAAELGRKFDIESSFIDAPTGL